MKLFVLDCIVFLLGPVMTLAGIAGIVLMWQIKNLCLAASVDFVCLWMILIGVNLVVVELTYKGPRDYGL